MKISHVCPICQVISPPHTSLPLDPAQTCRIDDISATIQPIDLAEPPHIWPECTANPNEKACAHVSSGGLLHTDLVGQIINTELRLRLLGVYSGPAPINTLRGAPIRRGRST